MKDGNVFDKCYAILNTVLSRGYWSVNLNTNEQEGAINFSLPPEIVASC